MLQRAALGGADVVQHGARRGCRRRTVRQTEALERKYAEMVLDQGNGIVRREHPVVERRLGEAVFRLALLAVKQRQRRSKQKLARSELL